MAKQKKYTFTAEHPPLLKDFPQLPIFPDEKFELLYGSGPLEYAVFVPIPVYPGEGVFAPRVEDLFKPRPKAMEYSDNLTVKALLTRSFVWEPGDIRTTKGMRETHTERHMSGYRLTETRQVEKHLHGKINFTSKAWGLKAELAKSLKVTDTIVNEWTVEKELTVQTEYLVDHTYLSWRLIDRLVVDMETTNVRKNERGIALWVDSKKTQAQVDCVRIHYMDRVKKRGAAAALAKQINLRHSRLLKDL